MALSDEALLEAMTIPYLLRLELWLEALHEHQGHPSIRREDRPHVLEKGFTCSCMGEEKYFGVSIRDIREGLADARKQARKVMAHFKRLDGQSLRKERIAERKAKSLLCRFLTKTQRCQLRATNSFDVTAADGRVYRVIHGSAVRRVDDGIETRTFCLVQKEILLPAYDLMLAQKVMLERDFETFLATAHQRLIVEEGPPEHRSQAFTTANIVEVPREVLNHTSEWAEQQLVTCGVSG